MSITYFDKLIPGYYVIEEKIARTKHIVRIDKEHAQFFGTKREHLSDMQEHYNVVQKLEIELERRSTAPRTS